MSKKKQKSIEELLEEALVPEEEQPYPVPENWVWVRLKSINKDKKRNIDPRDYSEEVFELYSVPSYDLGEPEYIKGKEIGSNKQVVKENEILLCKINPRINRVWIVSNNRGKYRQLASTEWIVISENKKIYPKYLLFLLKAPYFRKLITSNVSGVGGSLTRAKPKEVETYPIALPPFNEQKRIAEKVERLFAKIDEAKRLIEEVKGSFEFRWESILDKAFRGELTKKWRSKNSMIENADDIFKEIQKVYKKSNKKDEHEINPPYQIPQNWRWVRLGDIVDINPPKKKLADIEDDQSCTFIPMPSVSDKTGEIENPEIRKYAEVKKGYTFFLENDILFAKITPCMENGKTAIMQNLINGFGFGSTEFHVIRTNPYINTKLIYYLLRSKKFRMEAKKEMTGAVGQQRVPKSFLENYLFPLPPKAEQDKIVELLDKLYVKEVEISKIETLEGEIDSLRQSILNKAFRGELGTNDPTDEHAIELLKEVLKSK
ncbi:restriction endonuclease subunit S [Parageobacillus thermoglucosidasius]|nr:restriction endonuclease subunit S [Parageobacillus thermoglucosidasius]AEH48879.1 restriction modification system DNA specificity domain protein [Parageobacillus thermoglucosidasius C56-YS93]